MDNLASLANIASILTAIFVVIAAIYYFGNRISKRMRLEKFLQGEKLYNPNHDPLTTLHLIAKLGMTEEEIFRASSDSPNITRKTVEDRSSGLAKDILFEYVDGSQSN